MKKNIELCFAFAAQRTEFPDDPILKFENIQKQVEAPFTVYADFENILKELSGDGNKCQEHVVLMGTKLLVVYLELSLNRGYMLEYLQVIFTKVSTNSLDTFSASVLVHIDKK